MIVEFDKRKLKDLIFRIDFLEKSKKHLDHDIQIAYEEYSKDLDPLIVKELIKARKSLKRRKTLLSDAQIHNYYINKLFHKGD